MSRAWCGSQGGSGERGESDSGGASCSMRMKADAEAAAAAAAAAPVAEEGCPGCVRDAPACGEGGEERGGGDFGVGYPYAVCSVSCGMDGGIRAEFVPRNWVSQTTTFLTFPVFWTLFMHLRKMVNLHFLSQTWTEISHTSNICCAKEWSVPAKASKKIQTCADTLKQQFDSSPE